MRIAILFPVKNEFLGRPIKWLPISMPSLVGYLKKVFLDISFEQLDLESELIFLEKENKLNKSFLKELEILIFKYCEKFSKDNVEKFKLFFEKLDKSFNLEQYDHYFFALHNYKKRGLVIQLYLAYFLKSKYKDKKIIFGAYGFNDYFGTKSMKELFSKEFYKQIDFIDSIVIGAGENATKKLLNDIINADEVQKTYCDEISDEERLKIYPDYQSFKSIKHFNLSSDDLEKIYFTEFDDSSNKKEILFIPYFFSLGCFYSKCAYCSNSNLEQKTYYKSIDRVISDIKKLKKECNSNFFIFYNNNFNFDLNYAKKLLKRMIDSKLDILWTDCFNLRVIDDEMIGLLRKAGCFRMDIGVSTFNPALQKKYNNMIDDAKYLDNLEKISKQGIYTHINLIMNLPHQYSVDEEILNAKPYIKYIDGASINTYRRMRGSLIDAYPEQYDLTPINTEVKIRPGTERTLYFLENKYRHSEEKRVKDYISFYNNYTKFLTSNGVEIYRINLYLLGWLYRKYGFRNKELIKDIVYKASKNLDEKVSRDRKE